MVATAVAGCVKQSPVRALATPREIAVAHVQELGTQVVAVPDPFIEALGQELVVRNLVARPVAAAQLSGAFASRRDSRLRLQQLAEQDTASPYLLLVETRAEYYSQLNGRYRWTVYVKLTIARRDQLDAATVAEFDVPVVLDFDHERHDAAIAAAGRTVARRLGKLLDDFIAGQGEVTREQPTAVRADQERDRPGAIYFALVDRFDNGNPANDGDADPGDPQAFHGGDIEGLIERLDYIAELGFTSIWLSPVFQTRGEKLDGHGAFHGYWTEDLGRIDSRFGGDSALRRLADEARRRDIGLILDMVLNHVGYDAPLVKEKPEWFHRRGPITDWNDPDQLTDFDVHGLPDLAQEKREVYDHLLSSSVTWLEAIRPAGFRLDAVKHVPLSFWQRYNRDVKARADDSLTLIGEIYDGDPMGLVRGFVEGGFDALFDFPLHFAMVDVFCKDAHPGQLAAILALDRLYAGGQTLVTFADNHDLPRVTTACGGDRQRVAQLLAFLLTARGVPCITYGTEVGLEGAGEPDNRGDMVFDDKAPLGQLIGTFLRARAEHDVLARGLDWPLQVDEKAFIYARLSDDEVAVIGVNRSAEPVALALPDALRGGAGAVDVATGQRAKISELVLQPRSTSVWLISGLDGVELMKAQLARRSSQVPVTFDVTGSPTRQIAVVGGPPELGSWNPSDAASATVGPGGSASVTVTVPEGATLAYKLVALDGDRASWENGDNRYLFVDGPSPRSVALEWRN